MAKLRKRPKSRAALARVSKSEAPNIDSTGPPVLPVLKEQPTFDVHQLHQATNHERRRSNNEHGELSQAHQTQYDPRSVLTRAPSPASLQVKPEQPTVSVGPRRPSPLRISQEASAESEAVVAGPSYSEAGFRREGCGPSCQKCGRPRKPFSPEESSDELTRAPGANWPLPILGHDGVAGVPANANEKASLVDPQSEPEALPSTKQPRKRRKYFSLPSKSKPSFKGPTDLASSDKGKAVEPPTHHEPAEVRVRPVSAPSPVKSTFQDAVDVATPNPEPKPAAHVHFARDDHLGRFAAEIRSANGTTRPAHQQVPASLTAGRALTGAGQQEVQSTQHWPVDQPQQAPQRQPQASTVPQPILRPNPAALYEWPLITTLVNGPDASPSQRRPTLTNAHSRSSLSISKRPSRRSARPHHNPHIHAPVPGRTSSRHKALLQQSRKVSYIVEQASDSSNSSRDSISISILGMLQGFPGGELAATAKTEAPPQSLSEHPSLPRLQTYEPDTGTGQPTLDKAAPDEDITCDPYSPSDYGSEGGNDDDDDQPQPVTPPAQSDFSLTSYFIGDDKKLDLRPASTITQSSFSVGDDKRFDLRPASTLTQTSFFAGDDKKFNLRPASTLTQTSLSSSDDKQQTLRPASTVTQTSVFAGDNDDDDDRHLALATASTPPALSRAPTPTAIALTPSPLASPSSPISGPSSHNPAPSTSSSLRVPDSEGMIAVASRHSVADLPEVAGGDGLEDDDIDPDWLSWGALPGSYGSAGMWLGPSPGLEGGVAELGAAA